MKFCDTHWQKLRTAIDEVGLTKFVAKSAEEAAARLSAANATMFNTKETFEPLLCAQALIIRNVVRATGLGMLQVNEDGSLKCPLCYANEAHDASCPEQPNCTHESVENWVELAANGQLELARELGLLGEPS